jgi:CDP-glucose 4,6-dehydratase
MLLAVRLYEEPKRWGGSWNFAPTTHEAHTVQNVAEVIIGYLGKGSIEIVESQTQMHEARLLQLNCEKANKLLGWFSRWNAEQTLEATALWYKTIMNGGNAEQITRAQIHTFFPELT